MGLAEKQRVLARLYTDAPFRENFFADPLATGCAHGLDQSEARQLAQLSSEQVRFFARSLYHKRLQEVRGLLPLTSRVMAERFAHAFAEYAELYVPAGIKKHRADALGFSAFLEKHLLTSVEAAWVPDLVRYEASWLEAIDSPRCFLTRRFLYDVRRFARNSAREDAPPPERRPSISVWLRLSPNSKLRHVVIPTP